MNAKQYLVVAILLNVVLLAFAAAFWPTKRGANEPGPTALTGPSGRFGPVIETVLPLAKTRGAIDIQNLLDLETGRVLLQPPLEYFGSRSDAVMAWVRSNSLDISCTAWSGGVVCVTYDMIFVAVKEKCWEETTEADLLDNPALAPGRHSPRRLLLVGDDRPDTYMFHTGEGTLGMLRIVGVSENGQGVKIRYKLINPVKSLSVAL